jgi:thioesterase domain-containing protein
VWDIYNFINMREAKSSEELLLAVRLAAASGKSVVPLTLAALNNEASAPAFFCIHSVTGAGVSDFLDLAQEIGQDIRVFAVQAPRRLMADSDQTDLIDALAESHAGAIARAQPEGRIHLGGWSAGALVALETARRLSQRKREVGLLVSIDGAPKNWRGAGGRLRYGLKVLWNLPRALLHDDRRRLRRQLSLKIDTLRATKLGRKIETHHPIEEVLANFSAYPVYQQRFMTRVYDAIEGATFSPYDGQVVVYEAGVKPILLSQVSQFWRHIARSSETVIVPGTHQSMIRAPSVRVLADDLRRRLGARLEGTTPKPGP